MNVYFLLFKIFEQLALALKNRVALEFFTVLKYILLFRIFEELAVALKTEFALKFFKPGRAAAPPTSYAYSKFRAPSVFQGKRKLLKNSECKKYIQYLLRSLET